MNSIVIDQAYQLFPVPVRNFFMSAFLVFARPKMRSHFSQFISPGDLVFDIGANRGDLTHIFSSLCAQVVCIDPQPHCLELLRKRFASTPNNTIVGKGLGDKEGKLPFYVSSRSHSTCTFSTKMQIKGRYTHKVWDEVIDVPVTTLDALLETFGTPVFCKIDVEGFELNVIQGLHSSKIPVLSYEFTREFLDDAEKCAQHLDSLGRARFNYSLYFNYSLQNDQWLDRNQLYLELKRHRSKHLCGDIYMRF
ncbi:MAG: FkbM family methyltransferase [Chloroflexi bacterium]|nr:FkbM family methyltransferase [Chloroflexota bacterium]